MKNSSLAIQLHRGLSNPTLQSRYQNFLKLHPDGRISRKSFHSMMKECYPGADTEKLERHIFRMYDTNKVNIHNLHTNIVGENSSMDVNNFVRPQYSH